MTAGCGRCASHCYGSRLRVATEQAKAWFSVYGNGREGVAMLLKINAEKTKSMNITFSKKHADGTTIEQTATFKLLRGILPYDLSWTLHAEISLYNKSRACIQTLLGPGMSGKPEHSLDIYFVPWFVLWYSRCVLCFTALSHKSTWIKWIQSREGICR